MNSSPVLVLGYLTLRGLEDCFGNELGAMPNAMGQVDAEHGDGGTPDRRASDQGRTVPAKVTRPLVAAGVEEPRALARLGVDAREVRALVKRSTPGATGEAGMTSVYHLTQPVPF